jgi:murein L,D-transpeptidase YcbB/YkuD
MTHLLDPKEIEIEKKATSFAVQERVIKLQAEEARLNRVVCDLGEKVKSIETEVAAAEADKEYRLNIRRTVLQTEVEALESRRKSALKPIIAEREEIKKEKDSIIELKKDVEKREKIIIADKQEIRERASDLNKKEQIIIQAEKELGGKKESIEKTIIFLDSQTKLLLEKGTAIDEREAKIAERELAVLEREAKAIMIERANDVTRQQFADKDKEIAGQERMIADKYQTLQRAITESNKKNNIKI